MRTLWFKEIFVAAILSGAKTTTVRKISKRLPVAGELVAFSVGPRVPFTYAQITKIERVTRLSKEKRLELADIYGRDTQKLVQLSFEIQSAKALSASGRSIGSAQ